MGSMTMRRALLLSSSLLAAACVGPAAPAPPPEHAPLAPMATATALAPPAPSAPPPAPPAPAIPTLVAEDFAPGGAHPTAVFAIDGALMVVDDRRVGRIVGDAIEWLPRKIPTPPDDSLGAIFVTGVYGRWPDSIGVAYQRATPRIPAPVYYPLTGAAKSWEAYIYGAVFAAVQVGESTIVVSRGAPDVLAYTTVRGAAKRTPMTRQAAGCPERDARRAIEPSGAAATREGTMVVVGQPCTGGAGAEVWDANGSSRFVDLTRYWKEAWPVELLQGERDDLWAMHDPWVPALHFRGGAFDAVPDLGRPIRKLLVSRGALHATDGRVVYRLDASGWTATAILPPQLSFAQMVMDDQGTIWISSWKSDPDAKDRSAGVRRLRPGPATQPPAGCATPFVYLYAASSKNGTTYTYPATRKALSTFPEIGSLGLVEFDDGRRRLGVTVTSAAQGEALIAHLRQTMKDEVPRLFCYDVSTAKEVRKIPLP